MNGGGGVVGLGRADALTWQQEGGRARRAGDPPGTHAPPRRARLARKALPAPRWAPNWICTPRLRAPRIPGRRRSVRPPLRECTTEEFFADLAAFYERRLVRRPGAEALPCMRRACSRAVPCAWAGTSPRRQRPALLAECRLLCGAPSIPRQPLFLHREQTPPPLPSVLQQKELGPSTIPILHSAPLDLFNLYKCVGECPPSPGAPGEARPGSCARPCAWLRAGRETSTPGPPALPLQGSHGARRFCAGGRNQLAGRGVPGAEQLRRRPAQEGRGLHHQAPLPVAAP